MNSRYKVILSNNNIYKEIELSPELDTVIIGTSPESDIRLRRDLFFEPIEIILRRSNGGWGVFCSDNIYLSQDDIRKILSQDLEHGDKIQVKYQKSNGVVFDISYMIDFDYEKREYDIEIDVSSISQLKIGGASDCDLICRDEYLENDSLLFVMTKTGPLITDNSSKYGVFVNGKRISNQQKLQDCDFFSIAGLSFYYKKNKLYTSSSNKLDLKSIPHKKRRKHSTHFQYPQFNRNSRIQYKIPEETIEIQQATQNPKRPKKNIVMSLIPSIVMLAMTILLRGVLGGGGAFVIYSAISMGIGIVMSIASFILDGREYKKTCIKRVEDYSKYIDEKKRAIEELRAEELRIRDLIYESTENSINEVDHFGRRLFEKQSGDPDFLQVYLGRGRLESANPIKFSKNEFIDTEDPLATIPESIANDYKYIDNTPIISDFYASCGVGIVGSSDALVQMLKNLTLDISIRHFYNDVKLVYILNESYIGQFTWIRWLHNVENTHLDAKNIVCDDESKNLVLEDLYKILSARELMLTSDNSDSVCYPQYVVFVTNAAAINSHPVSKYFNRCAKYGFTFVFLEEYEENIPQGCTQMIRLADSKKGYILNTENGDLISEFTIPNISTATAETVALKLGAIMIDEVSLEVELTKNISLFELLDILSVEDIDLKQRWASSTVYKSLAAPLGVKSKNQTVYLDISDKSGAHGPHGLVAGTTGSGKSEVLQTYILSMATLYHPYEVGFVIIDFKGGGMANQFRNLPHLMGTITNIDGREINRSLLSIKSELVKRQEIFSQNDVNHINDYIKLYKTGKVSLPLPHLIMIVDEFAELKAEYPDFMKELISAARIGRTLGIHLILATQKPAGVVDAQIWSNSKFKLCLKVQTKEDSNEVIKTPLAAEIVEPGRAYFQVGNNEIFELFQSAYSGAPANDGLEATDNTFEIYERNIWGKKTLKYTNKKAKNEKSSVTQLQAIVELVHDHCLSSGIQKLPGICLPTLEDKILIDSLDYTRKDFEGVCVPVGQFDDPEQQNQGQVVLELSKDNVYIVGSSQSGKTVMLQTLIFGLIRKYTPSQVNVYIIDCGSMVLKIFEDSKHVGGVVLPNEEEKCKNLFKLLTSSIAQRKKILSGKGVGNYAAYLDAGYDDMPLIAVVIDNLAALKEYFPDQYESINTLTREAQSVGISFVITATHSNALSYRTQANFGKKYVLNCNDTGEFSTAFGHCKQTPKETAGRGLMMLEKRILEYQTAIFGKSEKEAERSAELKDYIVHRNSELSSKAIAIPMIPEKLSLSEAMADHPLMFRQKGTLPIGMDFSTVEFISVDISSVGSLTLLGDPEVKDAFLQNLIKMIAQTAIFHGIEAAIVDDKSKKLKICEDLGFVRYYESDVSQGMALISDFCDEVLHRCDDEEEEKDSTMMLIINNADVFKRICSDKNESKLLTDAIKSCKEAGAFIVLSTVENQPVGFSASEVLKVIKEEKQGILFAPITESKFFDISRPRPDASFDGSMGYRFNGASYSKIKIFDREVN